MLFKAPNFVKDFLIKKEQTCASPEAVKLRFYSHKDLIKRKRRISFHFASANSMAACSNFFKYIFSRKNVCIHKDQPLMGSKFCPCITCTRNTLFLQY